MEKSMHIALTGITGFVGKTLAKHLLCSGFQIRAFVRAMPTKQLEGVEYVVTGDYTHVQDWQPYLENTQALVHLAACAHKMQQIAESEYMRANVDVTRHLVEAAQCTQIKKIVFLSSVKVLGEETQENSPFTANTTPHPEDAYGRTKLIAEDIVVNSKIHFTILRAPLIYGQFAKGNLQTLQKLLRLHIPLPLASIHNKRSIVDVEHVSEMIIQCLQSDQFDNSIRLIKSGDDLSTPNLIRKIGHDIGVRPIVYPFPPIVLKWLCTIFGKERLWQRIGGNLQIQP